MAQSIKANYIFNLINTLAGILFPLITFPYASRIMEADGIGQIGFYSSIITYVSLFTSLGIPIYAIREIARVRDNQTEMSYTALEILILHLLLTIFGYFIVAVISITVEKVYVDIPLFLILSLSIFFTAIGCEWFYNGIEDFKYITIRSLIIKVFYVILLFSLVHTKTDLLLYAALSVLGSVGNNIFNVCRLRKYISLRDVSFSKINVSRHIYPTLKIFALNLVISLYVNLDTVMLGFMKDNSAVGYYQSATKISKMLLGVVQALQAAMIPRFSNMAKKETLVEFNNLCQKVVDFIVTISIPFTFGLIVLSAPLIHLFCGPSYEPAIITLQIMAPIIILIGLSGVACFQILYPLGKEKLAIMSTATGAVANLVACLLLIPVFSQNGAAIATVVGEGTVALTMFLFGRKYIHVSFYNQHYNNCIVGSLIMFFVILIFSKMCMNDWINIILTSTMGFIIYAFYLYARKDSFAMYLIEIVKTKREYLKNKYKI